MELNLTAEAARSFLGRATDKDGNDYTVKVIAFKEPIANTQHHGEIRSAALIESEKYGNILSMLFPAELTDEEVQKQAKMMTDDIDKIFEQYKKNNLEQSKNG